MPDKCKRQFIRLRERPAIPLASETSVTPSLRGFSAYWREVQDRTVGVSVHNMDTLHGNEPDIEEYKTVLMPVTTSHTTYASQKDFEAFKRQAWILAIAVVSAVLLLAALVVFVCVYVMVLATRGIA
jgi:hypothetical protein